jgi:acyl-CoA synthetase (AMP-forming)/AMP-acid ligase II
MAASPTFLISLKSPYQNLTRPPTIRILPTRPRRERTNARNAADTYAAHWRELRRRQLRVMCAFAACLTIGAIAVSLLPSTASRLCLTMAEVATLTTLVVALGSFICPRCEQPFFERSKEHAFDYFTKKCLHCDLARGTSVSNANVARAASFRHPLSGSRAWPPPFASARDARRPPEP